jgi:hypothetical protein
VQRADAAYSSAGGPTGQTTDEARQTYHPHQAAQDLAAILDSAT